jgi:hypothetical protein
MIEHAHALMFSKSPFMSIDPLIECPTHWSSLP